MTMTYKGFKWASGRNGRTTTMRWGRKPRTPEYVPAYGTELFVGPKGAGKTLLCAHRARLYYEGKKRLADGRCVCGDENCDGTWQVYTNLESPTLPEYGAWAQPLDIAAQMIDAEANLRHIIMFIDEITQMFNSRRSMMTEIIQMINRVTLIRKNLVQLWGTGISYDWLDTRIRDQASMVYNCWTPNQGRQVYANVHQLAMGHLPPHMRRRPPRRKWWWTEGTKRYYNHEETINFAADLAGLRTEPMVFVDDGDGNAREMEFREILLEIIAQLIEAGNHQTNVDTLIAMVKTQYGIPMARPYVRDWLIGSGFINDNGTFTIMTKGPTNALAN